MSVAATRNLKSTIRRFILVCADAQAVLSPLSLRTCHKHFFLITGLADELQSNSDYTSLPLSYVLLIALNKLLMLV